MKTHLWVYTSLITVSLCYSGQAMINSDFDERSHRRVLLQQNPSMHKFNFNHKDDFEKTVYSSAQNLIVEILKNDLDPKDIVTEMRNVVSAAVTWGLGDASDKIITSSQTNEEIEGILSKYLSGVEANKMFRDQKICEAFLSDLMIVLGKQFSTNHQLSIPQKQLLNTALMMVPGIFGHVIPIAVTKINQARDHVDEEIESLFAKIANFFTSMSCCAENR